MDLLNLEKFDKYAEFYNFLYKDRNYHAEASFINNLIKKYTDRQEAQIELLDLACGTGKHLIELDTFGYRGSGSDISGQMIEMARKNIDEAKLMIDLYNFSFEEVSQLDRRYDVVISMFSAFDYLTSFEQQNKALQNIHSLLNEDGLFIFDFWNGHAITEDHVLTKVLRKRSGNREILRISKTQLEIMDQKAVVDFTWLLFENNQKVHEYDEQQFLHYFYISEIKNLLHANSFEICHMCPFMAFDRDIMPTDWNVSIVARKKDLTV